MMQMFSLILWAHLVELSTIFSTLARSVITNARETLKFTRNGIGEQIHELITRRAWAWNEKRQGHK